MVYHQNQSICLDSKDFQTNNVKSVFFLPNTEMLISDQNAQDRDQNAVSVILFLHSLVTVIMPIYDVVRKLPLEKVPVDASVPEQSKSHCLLKLPQENFTCSST